MLAIDLFVACGVCAFRFVDFDILLFKLLLCYMLVYCILAGFCDFVIDLGLRVLIGKNVYLLYVVFGWWFRVCCFWVIWVCLVSLRC